MVIEKASSAGFGGFERSNQCAVVDRFAIERSIKPPPDKLEHLFEVRRRALGTGHSPRQTGIEMRMAAYDARHQYLVSDINDFVAGLWLQVIGAGHYLPIFDAQVRSLNHSRV